MQKIKNIFHLLLSWFFTFLYGYPIRKLKTILVTGTDGKTTTSFMIYQTLSSAGKKVGIVSTVEARIGDKHFCT